MRVERLLLHRRDAVGTAHVDDATHAVVEQLARVQQATVDHEVFRVGRDGRVVEHTAHQHGACVLRVDDLRGVIETEEHVRDRERHEAQERSLVYLLGVREDLAASVAHLVQPNTLGGVDLHLDEALVEDEVFGLVLDFLVCLTVAGLMRACEHLGAEGQLLGVVCREAHDELLRVAHVDQLGAHLGRPVANVVRVEDAARHRIDQELLGSHLG
jgi:hypothetical protein